MVEKKICDVCKKEVKNFCSSLLLKCSDKDYTGCDYPVKTERKNICTDCWIKLDKAITNNIEGNGRMTAKEAKRCEEIYQRLKKENPCIFCVQYDNGCQFKACDPSSLSMYCERNYLEIKTFLRKIYIKELEEENEKLEEKLEKYRKAVDKCLHITFIGPGSEVHSVPEFASLVDSYLTEVEGLPFWKN